MNRARAEAKRPLRDSGRAPQSANRPILSVSGLGGPFPEPEQERAKALSVLGDIVGTKRFVAHYLCVEGVLNASGTRSYEGSLPVRAETLVSVHEVNRARAGGHPDNTACHETENEEKEKILYCHECNYVFDSYGSGWRRCPECGSPVCDHRIGQCQCLERY